MAETKKFYCTRPKLLSELMSYGYEPIDIIPNFFNPKFKAWVFEETPQLRAIVDKFYRSLEK